jgi:quercetin dioxygenase-like cupin family protein
MQSVRLLVNRIGGAFMRQVLPTVIKITSIALSLAVAALCSEISQPQPLTLSLECPKGDCPLLQGAPQTTGMRSGFVRLKAGEAVGWHTTGQNEETLVILRGQGEALIEGGLKLTIAAPGLAYIPPARRHNVTNTGQGPLEYVYVVAPAKAP